jgi:hypothetical protein
MAKSGSLFAAARHISERFPILLLAGWAILYLPRPFKLGFYVDDWWYLLEPLHATAPFSLDRLHYFVGFGTSYASRPLQGLTAYLVTSIAGASPVMTQFISTLLVLAAALSLRSWLNRLLGIFPSYRKVAGDLAVIFWLAMPWMLGETAWPTVIHNFGAQILFTELARLLLVRERLSLRLAALVTAGIVGSSLFYEAFYFAILPVVVFYWIVGRGPAKSRRDLALLLGICCLAQAIPIAFNRYCAYVGGPVTKSFNHDWLRWTAGNLLAFPNALLNSFPEYRLFGLLLVIVVIGCALSLWVAGKHLESERLFRRYLIGLMSVAVAIVLISDTIYSAAGYGLASLGVGSRTFYTASLAFTIAFFALICPVFLQGARIAKLSLLSAAGVLVLVLGLAQHNRVAEWAYAWREELRILQGAPLDEIKSLPAQAAILYAGPSEYHGMVIFGTEWDLTAAVASRSPLNEKRRPFQGLHAIYPAGDRFTWSWDGATLSKVRSGRLVQTFPVQQLYLWRDGAAHLQPVVRGFTAAKFCATCPSAFVAAVP